jgi:uncharacterized membrane protein (UPF0127 family)
MSSNIRSWLIAVGVLVIAVAAVAYVLRPEPIAANSQAMILPTDPIPLLVDTASGVKSFTIEVADDVDERTAGLMFRETMDDDHGMLFVFPQTQPVGFWMKNTPMPLDLLFIGQDGEIKAIKPGEPFSEALIAPDEPVRFVLEFKQGTSSAAGIAAGDKVRHPAVNEAPGAGNSG